MVYVPTDPMGLRPPSASQMGGVKGVRGQHGGGMGPTSPSKPQPRQVVEEPSGVYDSKIGFGIGERGRQFEGKHQYDSRVDGNMQNSVRGEFPNHYGGEMGGEMAGQQGEEGAGFDQLSVHELFQLFQDDELTKDQFIAELGGPSVVPAPVIRLLNNDPSITFLKFRKAYGQANSFLKKSAGGRNKYEDSAASIICDNSGPKATPDTKQARVYQGGAAALTSFRRVSSDISREERAKPNFNVQKSNAVSIQNPMVHDPLSGNLGEAEGLIQSAVRMYLDGELKIRDASEYLSTFGRDKEKKPQYVLLLQELFNRHEVNGPFTFKYLMTQIKTGLGGI